MPFVVLQSSDDEKFFVDMQSAKHFGTVKNLLSCCGLKSETEGIIPLPNVEADTLRKVLDWIDHHKNDPILSIELDKDECPTINLSEWDKEYLMVEKDVLFKLLIAANYLDIPGLIHITSKEIADMMQGKTPQEIRDTFNIENDFTNEEEANIWQENDWLARI